MSRPGVDRGAIERRVLAVLRRHVAGLTSAAHWLDLELAADLALESITLVVILVELEESLAIEIGGDVDPGELRTGRDLVDVVAGLI